MSRLTAEEHEQLAPLIAAAERVLAGTGGAPVRLGGVERLTEPERWNVVLRCRVERGPAGAPATVIVKHIRADTGNAERMERFTSRFLNEWAGVAFLDALGLEPRVGPRFLGGDAAARVMVIEDLGGSGSLVELLLEGDAALAEQALTQLAVLLGRMHAASIGRSDEYTSLRAGLGTNVEEHFRSLDLIRAGLGEFRRALALVGVAPGTSFEAEVEAVFTALEQPGPFLAYTHADPCPDNDLVTADGLRLIDFEVGGFRHALIDAVYLHMMFPSCWCANRVPPAVLSRLKAAYRAELVRGCPQAADDAIFHRELAVAAAYALLFTCMRNRPLGTLFEADYHWGIAGQRQRVISRCALFAALAERGGHLPELRRCAERLAAALGERWPEQAAGLPEYPAFARTVR